MGSETQRLWYVRLAGEVRGPFPTAAVIQDLALGRLAPDTLLSTDRIGWAPAGDLETFSHLLQPSDPDAWAEERRRALRRWAEERGGEERRGAAALPDGQGTRVDRRHGEGSPRAATTRTSPSQAGQGRAWLVVGGLAVFVLLLLLLALLVGPNTAPEVRLLK